MSCWAWQFEQFGLVLSNLNEHFTVMFGLDGRKNSGLDLGLFNLLYICSNFREMKNSLTVSFRVFQNFCSNELEISLCSWLIALVKNFHPPIFNAYLIHTLGCSVPKISFHQTPDPVQLSSSEQTCAAFIYYYTPSFPKSPFTFNAATDVASIFSSILLIFSFVVVFQRWFIEKTQFSLQIEVCSTSLN